MSGSLTEISDGGARITFDAPTFVPRQSTLLLAGKASVRRRCRVVWNTGLQIGVQFVPLSDELDCGSEVAQLDV